MIYVFENPNNDASYVIDGIGLTEENKQRGIKIDKLPDKEEKEGKIAILKCSKAENKVWYEYVDKPIDKEDEIKLLKEKINNGNKTILGLMGKISKIEKKILESEAK